MDRKNWTEKEEKIERLIHSNNRLNDRLVLKLTDTLNIKEPMIGSLIGVFFSTKDARVRAEYAEALKEYLPISKILSNWESFFDHRQALNDNSIDRWIPAKFRAEMSYSFFKRTGTSYVTFLKSDSHHHPKRREVFDYFLKNSSEHFAIRIPNLSKGEIIEYLSEITFGNSYVHCVISKIDLNDLPDFHIDFRSVTLQNCICDNFPHGVFRFKSLSRLNIFNTPLKAIPEDWSHLQNLYGLRFDKNDFVFENFDFIQTLPRLKSISLGSNKIAHPYSLLTKKRLPLKNPLSFKSIEPFEKVSKRRLFHQKDKVILQMASAIGKAKISQNLKENFFYKFSQKPDFDTLPVMPDSDLISLLNVSFSPIKNKSIAEIAKRSEKDLEQTPLNKESIVLILGKPEFKETKTILKEKGLKTTKKTDDPYTHILICKSPTPFDEMNQRKNVFITEQRLKKIFETENPKFLQSAVKDKDSDINKKLKELLSSEDESNHIIAFEMMKSGGVPKEQLIPILMVAKTSQNSDVVKTAKALLKENAPENWIGIINDRQQFYKLSNRIREWDVRKKLKKISLAGSLEVAGLFSIELFKKYKKGLQFAIFNYQEPSATRTAVLKSLVTNQIFNYSEGLRFTQWKWYDHDQPQNKNRVKVPKFPSDVIDLFPNIVETNFHNCRIQDLPAEFQKFKSAAKIDLSYNFLTDLPEFFSEFQNLEHLNLSMNSFEEVPEILGELKYLKTLNLKSNRINMGFHAPKISDELKLKLSNCKILL